jgi:hypothetical protein
MIILEAFVWQVALIVSFAGWGALCATYVARDERADLGLRLGWGVACVLAIGAWLLAARLARAPVLAGLVAAGLGAALWDLWRRRSRVWPGLRGFVESALAHPATAALAAFVVLLATLRLTAAPFQPGESFHRDDDAVGYMFYPREILQTGSTVQPFSQHHSHSLNGQAFLQALLVLGVREEFAYGLDAGVFLIIALILLVGASSRPWLQRSPIELLPELGFVLLPAVRVNLASVLTGVVGMFTLYRTLVRADGTPSNRTAALAALVAAGTLTLRPFYLPALGLMLAFAYLAPLARGAAGRFDRERAARGHGAGHGQGRGHMIEALVAVAVFFAALVPWLVVAWRSDATPFFPLIQGNVLRITPREHHTWFDLKVLSRALLDDSGYRTLLVFVLAGLCLGDATPRRARTGLVLGAFATLTILVYLGQGVIRIDFPRYFLPTFGAIVLAVSAESMALLAERRQGGLELRTLGPGLLVVLATVMNLHESREAIGAAFEDGVEVLRWVGRETLAFEGKDAIYGRMQASAEPGAGILSATPEGYLFDFRRNHVYALDRPGLAAPAPGFPIHGSDEDYVRFLRAHGVRYLAMSAEKMDPYDMALWMARTQMKVDTTDPGRWIQSDWAPIITTVMNAIDRVAGSHKVVYREGGYSLVDLGAPG